MKRSLAVTVSLMAGIAAAILGLAAVHRPSQVPTTGVRAGQGAASAEAAHGGAKSSTVYGGFGGTGRSFGSIAGT